MPDKLQTDIDNQNFPNTPAGETFFQNLTTNELLRCVDRSRADVRALAEKLEIVTDLLEMAGIINAADVEDIDCTVINKLPEKSENE